MARKLRVGIIFGGRSAEHEVSVVSARNIMAAADRNKYELVPIGITTEGRWRVGDGALRVLGSSAESSILGDAQEAILEKGREVILASDSSAGAALIPVGAAQTSRPPAKLDVIFPVLHGTFGEDGTVQGLLELAGVAYVGAGVLGSAVGMDKDVMKRLFQQRGLPSVPYLAIRRRDFELSPLRVLRAVEKAFGYPVFVKPANLGSSVGIGKAHNRKELRAAMATASQFDLKILAERAIEGREIECAVLGNEEPMASIPGEVAPAGEFYDYAAKYLDQSARLIVPAPLRPQQVKEVQRLAIAAFQATECAGMARVDLFLEKRTGKFYLNEINTIPGFTSISMYPRLWEASGIPYAKLIDRLIELALERHREKKKTKFLLPRSGR